MAWANYHSHCSFCDGSGEPEASVEAALSRDVLDLGFSSHAPLPFYAPWCIGRGIRPADLQRYRNRISGLKRSFNGRIRIAAGLEVDYIPGLIGPSDRAFSGFDYRIGAVHFVGTDQEGRPWQMDDRPETFERGLAANFGGDIRALVGTYYRAVAEMAWLQRPEVIAHFDLVKKYNRGSRYFDEGETWYRALVMASLRVVAEAGCIVELNTGGMARGWLEEPYPSPWIVSLCRKLGIPMTLSSDCHRSADIDFAFAECASLMASSGYDELMVLRPEGERPEGERPQGWRAVAFGRQGIRLGSTRSAA